MIIIYDKDEEIYQLFEDKLNDTADTRTAYTPESMNTFANLTPKKPVPSYRSTQQKGQLGSPHVQLPTRPIPAPRIARPLRKAVREDLSNQTQGIPVPSPFYQPVARPVYQRPSRDRYM